MILEVQQTAAFREWLAGLKDSQAGRRIRIRIARLQAGLMGDVKFFEGIGELRIDSGPGYRVYFWQRDRTVVILLCGGDKSTQRKDIERAKQMTREI
jgi:putative addiction module killer protein